MKPGHTIFWKRSDGVFVEGVLGLAIHHDPNEKDHAVEMSNVIEASVIGAIELFDVQNGRLTVSHEWEYMKQNSKMHEH